ncbi:MAG: hypothetical protein JOZ17_24735, partial [Acetobacteraceae bacterium]|nr:hypothetical protein [Acetobacteraceae bacterium]
SGSIALEATPSSQSSNALTPEFATALRSRDFALAENGQRAPAGAHRVRYVVSPLDSGTLVLVTIDGSTEAARFFSRNTSGALQPGGPVTVTAENQP